MRHFASFDVLSRPDAVHFTKFLDACHSVFTDLLTLTLKVNHHKNFMTLDLLSGAFLPEIERIKYLPRFAFSAIFRLRG